MKKIIFTLIFSLFMAPAIALDGLEYINDEAGVHIYKINLKKLGSKIKPYAAKDLMTASELYNTGKYRFVVNGGFFDLATGDEVSFVKIDGRIVNSPFNNHKLISDLNSQDRLSEVINRPELRIFKMPLDKYKFTIEPHFAVNADSVFLLHSLQAGPTILPYYKPEVEGFVKYDKNDSITFDSIELTKKRERTILALKKNYMYLILFTENSKMTGYEIVQFIKKQKYDSAFALDGGGSTSAVTESECIKANDSDMRKIKSFLVIER